MPIVPSISTTRTNSAIRRYLFVLSARDIDDQPHACPATVPRKILIKSARLGYGTHRSTRCPALRSLPFRYERKDEIVARLAGGVQIVIA